MTLATFETWIKIIGGLIAAFAAIIATFKALAEWRRATEQRREELALRQREFRQKQAIFGREIVREIFADPKSRAALKMLDFLEEEYLDENGAKYRIQRDEIQFAMRLSGPDFTDGEVFVRTRFEALYDHLEQLEHLIALEVLAIEDIETAFRYYMVRLIRPTIQHFDFLDYYDYPRAKKFLLRFKGKEKVKRDKAS
jgi:hypothetical protein